MVLDASAVLAFLGAEPGADIVGARLGEGAVMSAVNLAEVASKLADRGMPQGEIVETIADLGVSIETFNELLAYSTGDLRRSTARAGLSLGDRACLALGLSRGLPVLTSDLSWSTLSGVPGLQIEQIR